VGTWVGVIIMLGFKYRTIPLITRVLGGLLGLIKDLAFDSELK
jgi:hypothetical protein